MAICISDIDFKTLLIRNYKKYKMNDLECMIILVCNEMQVMDKSCAISPQILSEYMSAKVDEIDEAMLHLLNLGYIEYVIDDKLSNVSLKKLKEKCFYDFKKEIVLENNLIYATEFDTDCNIFQYYCKVFGKQLSPIETDKLVSLKRKGCLEEEIKQAIDICREQNKSTINSVISQVKKLRAEKLSQISDNNSDDI